MPTFKPLARTNYKRQDNAYSVYIRVIHNRKVAYIKTVYSLEISSIAKNGKIKDYDVLDNCQDLIRNYRKKCNKLGEKIAELSVQDVVIYLTMKVTDNVDFFEFAYTKINERKQAGQISSASNTLCAVKALSKFVGKDTLDINSITSNLCREFYNHLVAKKNKRTPTLYLSNIRALISLAQNELNDEDLDIMPVKVNPFRKFKIPRQPKSDREITLNSQQIRFIYNYPENSLVKDVFMLSFFLIGMNAIDIYELTKFDGTYITYNRSKTKGKREDNALMKIKVPEQAIPIFEKYKGNKRVFNFSERYSTLSSFRNTINIKLKQIAKDAKEKYNVDLGHLLFYSARHSWATIAVNEVGIDKYTVHEALNHSDPTMKITDIYIKRDFSLIDNANKKVIDFVLNQ
jgi:integrase